MFEPEEKHRKRFERIRKGEEIPQPPHCQLPPVIISKQKSLKKKVKYTIIPKKKQKLKKVTYNITPSKSTSNTPIFDGLTSPALETATVTFPDSAKKTSTNRRIRQMTLSRPVKLESSSRTEFMAKYVVESSHIIGQGSFAKIYRCKKKKNETILAMKIVKKDKANVDDGTCSNVLSAFRISFRKL